MDISTSFIITGDDYTVTISGDDTSVGSIVQGVIDATLGIGDKLTIERVK